MDFNEYGTTERWCMLTVLDLAQQSNGYAIALTNWIDWAMYPLIELGYFFEVSQAPFRACRITAEGSECLSVNRTWLEEQRRAAKMDDMYKGRYGSM